jgi:hypothetical protein
VPIPVVAYTVGGVVRGTVAASGHLRDLLEGQSLHAIDSATFTAPGGAPTPEGSVTLEPDEILLAIEPEQEPGPVHANWHLLHLAVGPYLVEGELATLPGFDPARALARPTGTFVHLRGARVALLDAPETELGTHPAVLVHRYAVEQVEADLMLAFFFPGAQMPVEEPRSGATS